jgi:G-protein alpha subunit
MEADTASLFVHRDNDSFINQMTDNLSKMSIVFTFDWELFISKVYERVLRNSVKESLKLQKEDANVMKRSHAINQPPEGSIKGSLKLQKEDAKVMKRPHAIDQPPEGSIKGSLKLQREDTKVMKRSHAIDQRLKGLIKESLKLHKEHVDAMKRSEEIDRKLEEDSTRLRRECQVLVLGSEDSGADQIIKQMKIIHQNGYTIEELEKYRLAIYDNLIDSIQSVILEMQKLGIEPEREENKALCAKLMEYSVSKDPDEVIGKDIGDAISSIWSDPCISEVIKRSDQFYLTEYAA